MKKISIFIIIALSTICSAYAQQSFRSAFFLENYNFRHEFNPAFSSKTSYFAIPAISGFNLETQSNLGVSTFLYPLDGKLTTFMNPSVGSEEFLSKLSTDNYLNLNNSISLFSIGTKKKNSFTTFDISMRTSADISLPYSLFDFMKNVGKSQTYEVSRLSAKVNSRLEFAFGRSQRLSERLSIGARVKLLAGIANAEADIKRMDIRMTEDKWSVQSQGTLKASSFLEVPTKGESGEELSDPSDKDLLDFDNVKVKSAPSVSGFGVAVDLGAEFEIMDGLKLSLAVNDLGYMYWGKTFTAQTSGDGWSFDGFENFSIEGGKDNSLKKELDDLKDDMMDMFDFRKTETDGSQGGMLSAVVNASAEYTMPFYKALSVGILSTTSVNGSFTWSEARLFANIHPSKWLSCGLNCGFSKFGTTVGAAIGLHSDRLSFFIGSDHLNFKLAKAKGALLYPYNRMNSDVNFGITFNVGR